MRVLIGAILMLACGLAFATGGKPVVTGSGAVATATGGSVTSSNSLDAFGGAGGQGGAVNATIAGSGGANVETKFFSLGAPGYAGASACPVGVLPVIGGTTGAEFCRALFTALVTGDRGPICKSSLFSADMDEFCEDYWTKHGRP